MHSNGALQYTPDPLHYLERLCGIGAREMLWSRLSFSSSDLIERDTQVSHLIDNGPGKSPRAIANKLVKYDRTSVPESAFLAAHHNYSLVERRNGVFRFRLN